MVKGITAAEIDAALDASGRETEAIRRRWRDWRAKDIIPADAAGDDEAATPALASILFWLCDHAGLSDQKTLAKTWAFLARSHHPGQPAPIDLILADIAGGGSPVFVLTQWLRQWDGDVTLTMACRFDDQKGKPIIGPSPAHDPTADLVLDLRPLLARYVGANVVPFAAPDVVN
jgi:hypothetical protein